MTAPAQAQLVAVRFGSHVGYDRVVYDFGSDPVPPFAVVPQANAAFEMDPSNLLVKLSGSAGVRVVFSHAKLLLPLGNSRLGFPALQEARQIGNFEAVLSWGLGVQAPAYLRVSTLANPNRLVIDIAWVGSAATAAAAATAALGLYEKYPLNLNDPSAGYGWQTTPWTRAPMTVKLRDRLQTLKAQGYFGATRCGEDYIVGNQVGLTREPELISASAQAGGTVSVVIRGYLNNNYRDLTVVMARTGRLWLASDLLRGSGPDASVFAPTPFC